MATANVVTMRMQLPQDPKKNTYYTQTGNSHKNTVLHLRLLISEGAAIGSVVVIRLIATSDWMSA